MKKSLFILSVVLLFLFSSCIFDFGSGGGKIGGDTDLETNEVGYTYTGYFSVDDDFVSSSSKAKVISNEDGIIEIEASGKIPEEFLDMIPANPNMDEEGNITMTGKFKNSSEGLAYINEDGEQSVLVRYDCKVGDKWTYKTTIAGKKIEREVISKSTEDDFYWAGMMIKVIEIEQNLPYPGCTKAIYRANHKWGLVNVDVYLEDGQVLTMNL